MAPAIARWVTRHPLVAFFALAYALSWWPAIFYFVDLSPSPVVGFGPFLAALVVLSITRGRAGVVALLRRMVQWRARPVWYVMSFLLPFAIGAVAAAINVLLGAPAPSSTALGAWPGIFSTFFLLLLIPGIGGAWEEPGWRGFAQPNLQHRRSALSASILLGVLWAAWHLPLLLIGVIPWSDIILIVAVAVVLAWVFIGTGGSVLIVMVFHAVNNSIYLAFFNAMFSDLDSVRFNWLLTALWCLTALAVVLVDGPALRSRRYAFSAHELSDSAKDQVVAAG